MLYCIDDSLHVTMNPIFVTCEKQTEIVISELQNLGYTINNKTSVIIPSQKIIFFGVIIDSVELSFRQTKNSIKFKLRFIHFVQYKNSNEITSMIGLLIDECNAIFEGPLY